TKFRPDDQPGQARSARVPGDATWPRQLARGASCGRGRPQPPKGRRSPDVPPRRAPEGGSGLPAGPRAVVPRGGGFPSSILSASMGDTNISGQSTDAAKIAAAVSACLDLPRVMRELEVTLRQLRSVVTGEEDR